MTSPYTTALLNEPPATASEPYRVPVPAYAAQAPMMPMHVPAPIVVQGGGSSRTANAMMGLVVIALAVLASIAGFMLARQTSPTPQEFARYQGIAQYEGLQQGRINGYRLGHDYAVAQQRDLARLKAAIARQRSFNRGYRNGRQVGLNSWRRPRYSGYRGYYRPYRPYYGGGSQVMGALATAQQFANATGSAVDVEIY